MTWGPWVVVAALLAVIASLARAGWGAWLARAAQDPRLDPAARWVTPDRRAALEALLAEDLPPAVAIEGALELCAVHERLSWRGGLRRVEPLAVALPDDADGRALRAELALALGRAADAAALVAAVPPDHWRGCAVRARLYELHGDLDRAESAWVAARWLGPAGRRAALDRELAGFRARHRRTAHDPARLWERGP